MEPLNQAAHLIQQSQSVVRDLTTQLTEIQQAITRQQDMIDSLMPIAHWEEPEPEPEPEPEEPEDPEEPEEPELP